MTRIELLEQGKKRRTLKFGVKLVDWEKPAIYTPQASHMRKLFQRDWVPWMGSSCMLFLWFWYQMNEKEGMKLVGCLRRMIYWRDEQWPRYVHLETSEPQLCKVHLDLSLSVKKLKINWRVRRKCENQVLWEPMEFKGKGKLWVGQQMSVTKTSLGKWWIWEVLRRDRILLQVVAASTCFWYVK